MPGAPEPSPPADEEHPAGEHEVIADPGPTTEERHAIADQPTQMFDVQAHVDAEAVEADRRRAGAERRRARRRRAGRADQRAARPRPG